MKQSRIGLPISLIQNILSSYASETSRAQDCGDTHKIWPSSIQGCAELVRRKYGHRTFSRRKDHIPSFWWHVCGFKIGSFLKNCSKRSGRHSNAVKHFILHLLYVTDRRGFLHVKLHHSVIAPPASTSQQIRYLRYIAKEKTHVPDRQVSTNSWQRKHL